MLVRSVDPGGAVAQQSIISQQQQQILRTGWSSLLLIGFYWVVYNSPTMQLLV